MAKASASGATMIEGRGMWEGSVVELNHWSEFGSALRRAVSSTGHHGLLLIRNFGLVTCELDADMQQIGETDRLALVRQTGTDRDLTSAMWNVPGHDYEHDRAPSSKRPKILFMLTLLN